MNVIWLLYLLRKVVDRKVVKRLVSWLESPESGPDVDFCPRTLDSEAPSLIRVVHHRKLHHTPSQQL